jgi:hypothetical protein
MKKCNHSDTNQGSIQGFIIIDITIALTILLILGNLLLFFTGSVPRILQSQKKIISQIEAYRNNVIDPSNTSFSKHYYNTTWQQLTVTTSSNITINALVPHKNY